MKKSLTRNADRRGFVLLVVLVTVLLVSLSAYTFSLLMVQEQRATQLIGRQTQSRYLVESGVDFVRLFLSVDDATIGELGGLWNNPDVFQNRIVSMDPNNESHIGRFSILTSSMDREGNPEGFRYGLTDESSKLNLNTLVHADSWLPDTGQGGGGRLLLMALPLMTEDVADAILDWLDTDSDPRDFGVENYSDQTPPYQIKNGPLDSIEELLQVRGVTPQLLFGLDTNHNGIVDLDEQFENDNNPLAADPSMQLGWANYLTLFSKESNLTGSGQVRVNINSSNLETLFEDLRTELNEEWTTFIVAYRINGPFDGDEEAPEEQPSFVPLELQGDEQASATFNNVLDLIDARTTLAFTPNGSDEELEAIIDSPITMDNLNETLPILLSFVSTIDGDNIPGRVNIMQASRTILAGIPGMTDQILEQIISRRNAGGDEPQTVLSGSRQFETWLLTDRIVDLETMQLMFPFVCVGGDVFKAEVVGFFDDSVATSRAEVILDQTVPTVPRILFWRDKSHLPSGFTIETLMSELQTFRDN